MDKLTLTTFTGYPDDNIIASGFTRDNPEGVNVTNSGKKLKWVAKKGSGQDWAIYVHWANKTTLYVTKYGDKVTNESNIKKLVPCDDNVYKLYRF